jgi:hypothetical protein
MLTTKALNRASKFIGLTFQDFNTGGLESGGALETLLSVADETNQNLAAAQKELLLWHQRLGHADMQLCQMFLSRPANNENKQILVPRQPSASACSRPLCASCQVGKQMREGAGVVFQTPRRNRNNLLRQANLVPASKVSINQFMLATHGRLPHTKGKEDKSKQYTGGTIFVNHATTWETLFKKDGKEISDYSWMAPNNSMSCWEKAHTFYIPRGLFRGGASMVNHVDNTFNLYDSISISPYTSVV